jgi:hypothetical protein
MSLFANFLNTAYDYLSPPASPLRTPQAIPVSREPSASVSPLKERLDAACQSPTSTLAHLSPNSMRRELDVTKHDLARAHVDSTQLKERCKMLEKTLKETRELLRTREAELEKLRRERDRERAMAERRRSDVGPQYQSQQHLGTGGPRNAGGSLDTRMSSADLARQMHGHGNNHDDRAWRTPSPSRNSSASASTSASMSASSAGTGLSASQEEDRARFRSAETYMTRIDSWSGAQVLQAVHDINSEILQFSASATEMCNFLPAAASPSNPRLASVLQDTTARIGPNMTRILASRDHSQEPLLVQLALQGCVSLCIARALNSFCIGFPSKSDAVLAQIYNSMRVTEPQPTSAKWRALTHQHIHTIYPTLTEYSVNELADTILRWCTDIFLLANCQSFAPPPPAVQSPASSPTLSISPPSAAPPPSPGAQLRSLYLDQIKRISHAVMRLASVTREEIMSTSFEVTIADPSGSFVAGEMVDAFGDYGESHGMVLATMELGLRCSTRVSVLAEDVAPNGNGQPDEKMNGARGVARAGGEGMLESRLLLQPKVVLESVLEVLDR